MKPFHEIDSYARDAGILPARLCLPSQHVSWRIGTESYTLPLSKNILDSLMSLGTLCEKCYRSLEALYSENAEFRNRINFYRTDNFLSNSVLASKIKSQQIFYRPDIVLSKDGGFKIAEIDALPGELGVHCFLRDAYGLSSSNIISAILTITESLGDAKQIDFVIDTIASEDEYIAEYSYLARKLKDVGVTLTIFNINDYQGPSIAGTLVYRFFDMVHNDQNQIKNTLQRVQDTESVLYPALKHYTEEKLALSYLHREDAEEVFLRFFRHDELEILRGVVPKTHFIDKVNKVISPAIQCDGKTIRTFAELVEQAPHIPYVLKTSAFSDSNSASKGATLLEGLPKEQARELFEKHIYRFEEHFILQEKIDPLPIKTMVMNPDDSQSQIVGFSRLTPFYFLQNGQYEYTSAHIVIRANSIDVHFAPDATVIPAI
jgi:hypothetical protein